VGSSKGGGGGIDRKKRKRRSPYQVGEKKQRAQLRFLVRRTSVSRKRASVKQSFDVNGHEVGGVAMGHNDLDRGTE